jgi:multiple antibiotic resistance protein
VNEILDRWIIPFVSIFFIVDPLAAIPAFLTMTASDDSARRRRMALKASIACVVILAIFALAGELIFRVLGVTLPAFQIAGGIILGLSAIEMIRVQRPSRETPAEIEEGVEKPDVAITPLAIPMLAGPGAISTVMVLVHGAPSLLETLPIYAAIVGVGVATYFSLRLSEPANRLLGKTGINVMTRIMGLVLATIAVQFVLDGIKAATKQGG